MGQLNSCYRRRKPFTTTYTHRLSRTLSPPTRLPSESNPLPQFSPVTAFSVRTKNTPRTFVSRAQHNPFDKHVQSPLFPFSPSTKKKRRRVVITRKDSSRMENRERQRGDTMK